MVVTHLLHRLPPFLNSRTKYLAYVDNYTDNVTCFSTHFVCLLAEQGDLTGWEIVEVLEDLGKEICQKHKQVSPIDMAEWVLFLKSNIIDDDSILEYMEYEDHK